MQIAHFKRIIVIGCGIIAGDVLQYVFDNSKKFGYETECVEYGEHELSSARRCAEKNSLPYHIIGNKEDMFRFFVSKADVELLIISAGNFYLFPKELIHNSYVKIINFHNALLPKYPGRNAVSWAIYENQKVTGITWHYVNENIDEGNIIIQKSCTIEKDVKAYELVKLLMGLAFEAFCECFEGVLTESVVTRAQYRDNHTRVYKSYEIPGNANFILTDDVESIYRLLRALDYGKSRVFPMATTEYHGKKVTITKYKVIKEKELKDSDCIYLTMKSGELLRLRYSINEC